MSLRKALAVMALALFAPLTLAAQLMTSGPRLFVDGDAVSQPLNTVRPTLTPGTGPVGTLLELDTGAWTNNPTSYNCIWLRDWTTTVSTSCTSYTVDPADEAHELGVLVTGVNAAGPFSFPNQPTTSFTDGTGPIPGAPDGIPDQFTFTDQTGVALSSTITSSAVTIAGMGSGVTTSFSVTGSCTIDKNGASFSTSQTLGNSDTTRARLTSSGLNSTATNCTVTGGGVSDTFTATTLSGGGGGTVTAALEVSRTSGPAPLGVRANALGTTHTDSSVATWRQVGYSFYSGDAGAGADPITGEDRNQFRGGPQATFVYETAGTYTMKVRAYHAATGGDDQEQVTITVTSADTYYSGTNTICLSLTTDQTGCPSGASQQNNVSSWPTWTSSRRYLLRAGQSFSSLGSINLNYVSNIQVGKFGSGAKPSVNGVAIMGMNPTGLGTSWPSGITVMDLQTYVYTGVTADNVLILRVDAPSPVDVGFGLDLNSSHYAFNMSVDAPVRTALRPGYATILYEVTAGGHTSNSYNVFGAGGDNAAVVGSDLGSDSANLIQHNIRFGNGRNIHIARNRMRRPGGIRLHLKMHANGTNTPYNPIWVSGGSANEYALIQQNIFGNAAEENHPWGVQLSPQNNTSAELNRRFIFEGNVALWNYSAELVLGGEDMVWRGNSGTDFNVYTDVGMEAIPSLSMGYHDDGVAIAYLDPT